MAYPRMIQTDRAGIILVDMLMALALGGLFIAIVTASSLDSRNLFNRSSEREKALDAFVADKQSFDGMMPGDTRSLADASATAKARWYGNDRIETDIIVNATGTSGTGNGRALSFSEVRMYPYAYPESAAGTPLCSADFLHGQTPRSPHIEAIQLPVNSSIPLTDVQVRNVTAYISANSSVTSDPDLYAFDVADTDNATLLFSINTGPGINAISLAGKRIYAAADSAAAQLHVIRFDSPANPILESKFKLPLPYATATAPVAASIFYDSDKVYLGTPKWDGEEFNVIDVSNPSSLQKVGGLETGTQVNALHARNGTVYAGSSDQDQLRVIDARDPSDPVLTSTFGPSGWQRQEGQSFDFFEGALSFGRTSGGFDIPTEYELFAWSTTSLQTLANPFSLNNPGGVYGIIADRFRYFLGTRQTGKEFQIVSAPLSVAASSSTYPLPASVQAMTCDGDAIYILGHTAPVLYKITF